MRAKTCLRFPGGKFYGWKKIKYAIDTPHREYRELMVGGGSIFLGKNQVETNWINDIDSDLINFYKVIKNESTRHELYQLLRGEKANKQRYESVKNKTTKDKIESAYKFFYLNRTSFSGIMVKPRWGYLEGSSVKPKDWIDLIEPVAQKTQKIRITCKDFREVLTERTQYRKKDVLLYIDPPYYKASKNIYRNHFSEKDHHDLQKLLRKTQYKFVLSYDNVENIRNLYDWANIHSTEWTYFMSENRRLDGKELIITNFDQ